MFRQIAARMLPNPTDLFNLHPIELASLLDVAWSRREQAALPLGHPSNRSNVNPPASPVSKGPLPLPLPVPNPLDLNPKLPGEGESRGPQRWDHLIYAYMIENTRVFEVFRRVIAEFVQGEKLGTPLPEAQRWLRNTEELFFKDGAPFLITSLTSHLRNDARAGRRNAYQRMFGMELNHGGDDGKPYPYLRADAANNDFVATFEEFLREVWIGMTYVNATTSANPTDPAKIALLAERLHDMFRSRRQNGNLSREELSAVSAMSWFHFTLEFNSPILLSLRADATGTEQRLFKVAERVGLPAHGLAKHFFEIADPLSRILIQIETGEFNSVAAVPALFTPDTTEPESPEAAMRQIILNWTAIRGVDVKSRKVTATA
jgi:hypothetical protein